MVGQNSLPHFTRSWHRPYHTEFVQIAAYYVQLNYEQIPKVSKPKPNDLGTAIEKQKRGVRICTSAQDIPEIFDYSAGYRIMENKSFSSPVYLRSALAQTQPAC